MSPPSRNSTRSSPRSARTAFTDGRQPVEPADPAVDLRERREILSGERMSRGDSRRNAEALEEMPRR